MMYLFSSLRKVLFLEPHDSYCGKDNWPPETDRGAILQLMTESTLKGDTLMRILVIGLDRDLPLSPSDALDITDKLVARAANVHTNGEERMLIVFCGPKFLFVLQILNIYPSNLQKLKDNFEYFIPQLRHSRPMANVCWPCICKNF